MRTLAVTSHEANVYLERLTSLTQMSEGHQVWHGATTKSGIPRYGYQWPNGCRGGVDARRLISACRSPGTTFPAYARIVQTCECEGVCLTAGHFEIPTLAIPRPAKG